MVLFPRWLPQVASPQPPTPATSLPASLGPHLHLHPEDAVGRPGPLSGGRGLSPVGSRGALLAAPPQRDITQLIWGRGGTQHSQPLAALASGPLESGCKPSSRAFPQRGSEGNGVPSADQPEGPGPSVHGHKAVALGPSVPGRLPWLEALPDLSWALIPSVGTSPSGFLRMRCDTSATQSW